MTNAIGYYEAAQAVLKTCGKLIGKNKAGVEVYSIGENVLTSFKGGKPFKTVLKNAAEKASTVFDFENQVVINSKKSGETCFGLSKTYQSMINGDILGELKMFVDKRGIAKVSANTTEGNMFGMTYADKLLRRFSYNDGVHQGRYLGYKIGLKEFFTEFRARISGKGAANAVPIAAKAEPAYINVTEMLRKTKSKLGSYMSMVPKNSKLKKPVIIEHEGIQTGFMIDKTAEGKTKIIIKAGKDLRDWDNDEGVEFIEALVDAKGQMYEGHFSGRGALFKYTREGKNIRRIQAGNEVYLPVGNTPKSWTCKAENENQIHALEVSILDNNFLGDLFLDWAELKATVV